MEKIDQEKRDFLKIAGVLTLGGLTFSNLVSCATLPGNRRFIFLDRGIKEEDPKIYGASRSLLNYLDIEKFKAFVTADHKVMVFDKMGDGQILIPSLETQSEEYDKNNRIETIGIDYPAKEFIEIGKTLEEEVSSLGLHDVKAITAIIPCPKNFEYIQRGPIGYTFGSPLKQVIVKQTDRNQYEFEVRDKERKWFNGNGREIKGIEKDNGIGPNGPGPDDGKGRGHDCGDKDRGKGHGYDGGDRGRGKGYGHNEGKGKK